MVNKTHNMSADVEILKPEEPAPKDVNLQELIRCIISIEEAKDPYTAQHSQRVKELSVAFAELMRLSKEIVDMIANAAYLHDIGKVGISDAVLMKPDRLTDEEFEIIKKHPIIGAKILMQSNYTHDLVQMVLHHHERWDGKGYPDNISNKDIPLGARIIAIADSIDAMASKRYYKDSLPTTYCKEEIEKNMGTMYDPVISRIVLDNWNVVEDILLTHPNRFL